MFIPTTTPIGRDYWKPIWPSYPQMPVLPPQPRPCSCGRCPYCGGVVTPPQPVWIAEPQIWC